VAEQVSVDLPRPRSRAQLARQSAYYDLRTRLIDFLVERAHRGPTLGDGALEASNQATDFEREASMAPIGRLAGSDSVT
jgi:hypothetical protein